MNGVYESINHKIQYHTMSAIWDQIMSWRVVKYFVQNFGMSNHRLNALNNPEIARIYQYITHVVQNVVFINNDNAVLIANHQTQRKNKEIKKLLIDSLRKYFHITPNALNDISFESIGVFVFLK